MAVDYSKLWDILNEGGMMKTELIKAAQISTKNEEVRMEF